MVEYEVYEVKELDIDWEKVGEETDETMKDMKKSMDEGFLEEYEELVKVEKQEKKKSRKIVVPSTAVPQYGGGQGVNKEESITIRRDGCVKFSQGLCIRLLRYNRDRIIPLLPNSNDEENKSKVWLQMDTEIKITNAYSGRSMEDTRKRIRLEHEYDDRGIRQTKRYGEIYLPNVMSDAFEPMLGGGIDFDQQIDDKIDGYEILVNEITSVKLVKGNGLRIDDHYTKNSRKYTMIELDASVIDWENPDSEIVQRNPDVSKRASLEEHFVDEEIED